MKPRNGQCHKSTGLLRARVATSRTRPSAVVTGRFDLTTVLISHHLGVVRQISDPIAVMYLGDIVELALAKELLERPAHPIQTH